MDIFNQNDKLEDTIDQAKDKAHDVYENGKEQVYKAQKQLQSNYEELVTKIKEKPVQSVLIGVSIGYFISKLIK